MTKIVIVDDHPLVRRGLASTLSLDGTMEILGEAKDYREAVELFRITKPDMALVDLRLANESGLELIKNIMKLGVECKYVVLTSSTDEEDFRQAKEIGVEGYLLKEAFPEELLYALRIISKGRKYYDPGILDLIISAENSIECDETIEQLTPKEKEVLIELGKGFSNKEISQTLFITEFTVKKHVSQILAKLELADRTQAALYANARGLVTYMIDERTSTR